MSAGQSGWHRIAERQRTLDFAPEFDGVTQWERLLKALGIAEDEAVAVLSIRGDLRGEKLRRFARKRCRRRYVPEPVLELLGLSETVDRSWGLSWAELRNEPGEAA
jgi:hypothetical protein